MKKIFLAISILSVIFLSACSIKTENKLNQEDNQEEEQPLITKSVKTESVDANVSYVEDLQPGYNYGVEGITVKSVKNSFFPEGTINEWTIKLVLDGELSVSGKYYVAYNSNNPYCLILDNPNLLPQIGSKRADVVAKYGLVLNNSELCFMDEQSDALAVKLFGTKFNGDVMNSGRAMIKVKDILIYKTTTAESYNSAVLLDVVKE